MVYKAGFTKVAVTPGDPMWMTWYVSQTHQSESKIRAFLEKALAVVGEGKLGNIKYSKLI